MEINFLRILFYLKPHIKKHWVSLSLVFIGYGSGILFSLIFKPYIYKEIVDVLISGGPRDKILTEALHLGGIVVISIILYTLGYRIGEYASSYFQSNVMKELYDSTFKRLLKHSYSFFSNNFSGSIVAKAKRFNRSFEVFSDVITFQVWASLLTLTGVIIVLLIKAPILGYIFLFWGIAYIAVTILFIRKKIEYDLLEAEADSLVTGKLSDAILNILNIKIFSSDTKEQETFEKATNTEEQRRRRAWYFAGFQNMAQSVLMGTLQGIIIFVSIKMWYAGTLTVGMAVMVQTYAINLFDILWELGRSLTKAVKALTDMKEVVDIFDLEYDITDPENPEPLKITEGKIVFENISFAYKGGVPVFKDFSMSINPGERIGIVGHSGAGKSTITKLLLRFTDVTSGAILIDGQDIRNITQNDLRSTIAYVPQESILFHRTIRENIAYSRPDATDKEIETVAAKAHSDEFIAKLPQGYNTLVGERGVKLSGGERQRIAIARAMLKNAPILVLDEATSSLDSVSEGYIQDAFTELMKGKTTLVIAHRLSTIQKMDRIVVLDHGNIVEMGTHKELIEKSGIYADLWNRQSGGFIQE
jgi:ATP-binding cassette subfamily B protein